MNEGRGMRLALTYYQERAMRDAVLGDILHKNRVKPGWNTWRGPPSWTTIWEWSGINWHDYIKQLCIDLGVGRER